MKKHFQLLIFSFISLLIVENAFSQLKDNENPEKCQKKLSEFLKQSKVKKYDLAYDSWKWCFENCPTSNINIYYYGLKIVKHKYRDDKETYYRLVDSIYAQRIAYFSNNLSKVYSDWATSLDKRGASKEKVFEKLEAGFKANPSGLSVKNIAKFFKEVTNRNKDTNVQKVFDTYNNLLEAVNVKIDKLSKELDLINAKEAKGLPLTSKEKRKQKNNAINLRGLGQVETLLDQIIAEVAICERLVPFYQKGFETHKTDGKWVHRTLSRLNYKNCTKNKLYPKLIEAYKKVEPPFEGIIFNISNNKDSVKALKIREFIKAEKEPYKKAEYLYKIARQFTTNPPIARQYAYEALEYQPSMGKAYLLIARFYAKSANKCGTDEFSKRMVYVAAVNMARKAKEVDPSITTIANKYIKSYTANFPTKRTCGFPLKDGVNNSKKEFHIKCWIGETVIIP